MNEPGTGFAAELELDVEGEALESMLEVAFRYCSDEEIADRDESEIRGLWLVAPGRAALLEWIAARRKLSDCPDGPLTLQEQADDYTDMERIRGSRDRWIVFGGDIVRVGGPAHRELLGRMSPPVVRRDVPRGQGRGRSGRRRARPSRRTRARPGRRSDDPEPVAAPTGVSP